jgi:hypothetical protein
MGGTISYAVRGAMAILPSDERYLALRQGFGVDHRDD